MDKQNQIPETRNIIKDYLDANGYAINPMTTLGDLVVAAASGVPGRLALGTANQRLFVNAAGTGLEWEFGSKAVAYTHDMTLVSGDVAYTGAGFKPRTIIVLAVYTLSLSIGFGDIANTEYSVRLYGATLNVPEFLSGYLITLAEDAGMSKYQIAVLKSMDADGCTLTWTKGGTPAAGNGNFVILYLR